MTVRIFRWRAIGPLLILAVIGAILWWLFADTIARRETQNVGTQMLGARVEIEDLHLDLANGDVTMRGLTIASPHEALKNLLQADEIVVDLDMWPLTEKKIGTKNSSAKTTLPSTTVLLKFVSGATGML